jgi:hypothetical protein
VLYSFDYDIGWQDISTGGSLNLTNTPDKFERDFQWWSANPDLIVFTFDTELSPGSGHLATINHEA